MYHQLRSILTRRRTSKCLLSHLPNELLLLIAAHLAPSLCDINSFLRSSRFLRLLLTPVLHTWALSAPDRYGRSVIRTAAARGNTELLQQLLRLSEGAGVNSWEPTSWTTVLHAAVMLERPGAVTVLLAHGAGISMFDNGRWTALHWAALSGNCGIARELLRKGSKVCWRAGWPRGGWRTTPLHLAAARGDADMVTLLMQWGACATVKDAGGISALDQAVAGDWTELVKLMEGAKGSGTCSISIACRRQAMGQWNKMRTRWRELCFKEKLCAGLI